MRVTQQCWQCSTWIGKPKYVPASPRVCSRDCLLFGRGLWIASRFANASDMHVKTINPFVSHIEERFTSVPVQWTSICSKMWFGGLVIGNFTVVASTASQRGPIVTGTSSGTTVAMACKRPRSSGAIVCYTGASRMLDVSSDREHA